MVIHLFLIFLIAFAYRIGHFWLVFASSQAVDDMNMKSNLIEDMESQSYCCITTINPNGHPCTKATRYCVLDSLIVCLFVSSH